jgi:D-alanyl-lipoteichoic acid acyltransferase DltB (MBOAT superfamily)
MYFTSSIFILFLTLFLAGYYIVPRRLQTVLLLLANCVFYLFSGWGGFVCIAVTSLSVWYAGIRIDDLLAEQESSLRDMETSSDEAKALRRNTKARRRRLLILCIVLNIGILAVAKYTGFVTQNLNDVLRLFGASVSVSPFAFIMPLGISFYTFKAVSYIVDIYRSKKSGAADRSLLHVALFVSFFPEIIQGPISRYRDLRRTLFERHVFDSARFMAGLQRVLWGFFKKLVVADRLLPAVVVMTESPEDFRGIYVLLAMWFYAVTLYADFTGGIDITIGIAQMMGIDVTENFNRPFYSKSITEYWRRWHITMGTWFKDYLFYPLSTSRILLKLIKPSKRIFGDRMGVRVPVYLVTIILWFATGLWHGASWNFIVWGLANGVIIIISQELSPLYKRFHARFLFSETAVYNAFQVVRTFCLMSFIRTFDIYHSVEVTLGAYASVVTNFGAKEFARRGVSELGLLASDYAVVILGVCVMILAGVWRSRNAEREISLKTRVVLCFALFFATVIVGGYGIGYDASQFIYNRF